MADDPLSARVAQAVLDGERIDWARVGAVTDPPGKALVENLRAVDRISRAADAPAAFLDREPAGWLAPLGWSVVVAFAVVHVVAAAAAYVVTVAASGGSVPQAASMATVAAFGGAAAWLAIGGHRDDRSRYLAAFFLVVAAAFARQFLGPLLVSGGTFLVRGLYPDAFLAFFLWKFVRRFPRVVQFSRTDRWCRHAERLALVAALMLTLANTGRAYGAEWVPEILLRSHPTSAFWAILVVLSLPALPVAWLRARWSPPHERRRLRLFAAALAAGLALPLLELFAELAMPAFGRLMSAPGMRRAAAPFFFLPLLAVPFLTAYAVLVNRALEVHVVVGRALQYALTRTAIAAATLLPIGALAAYGYRNRGMTLSALLSGPTGMLLASLALAGVATWAARGRLLTAVNRHFFRGEVDLGQELARISTRLRNTRSVAELGELLETEIRAVLHVRSAAVYMSDTTDRIYAPVRSEAPALAVDGALGTLMRAGASPLSLAPHDRESFAAFLPAAERRWVEETGAALVVPLVGSRDRRVGALVLGAKASEIPFGPDEQAFLRTLASAAALAVETRGGEDVQRSPPDVSHDDEPASECPDCGRVDGRPDVLCTCGARRRVAALPPVLGGKFAVERRLGAGGMGVVYQARDLALDRIVALKTLPHLSSDAAHRLAREARMMAAVTHPALAMIFGVEWWRDAPVLVVEFLEGGSLAARRGPQPTADVIRMGVHLARALEALHEAGVLHRDIKPSNIAFTAAGRPKLLDFGLASVIESPAGDTIAGTPLYLSPEAAHGAAPAADVDVWGLSLVLYEAIAGVHPFAAPTIDQVLRNVRHARVPGLQTLRPDCPAAVASAFADVLSADRARRPASAAALRRILYEITPTDVSSKREGDL